MVSNEENVSMKTIDLAQNIGIERMSLNSCEDFGKCMEIRDLLKGKK